ncbi:MAG: dephospho-CoA kinase [Bacteroidales bacterium]|nr:dephospho-CoA kinase [Bacteroidales bacterium]
MISIGLTGGIGSGKTTISKIFINNWNIPVYFADERAKWIMQNNETIKNFLIDILGSDSYTKGTLNKKYVASIIFNNENVKQKLEAIVHQAVMNDYNEWKWQHKNAPYVIHEAALIFESKLESHYDKIISVISPLSLRLNRLKERGMELIDIEQRIKAQTTDEYKKSLSDFIVINDEQHSLIEQVLNIHKLLIK